MVKSKSARKGNSGSKRGQSLAEKKPPAPPRSVASIVRHNREIASQIDVLVKAQQATGADEPRGPANPPDTASITPILAAVFENISQIDESASTDVSTAALMRAWESFFAPIVRMALLKPYGNFVAARMVLYLTQAVLDDRWANRRFNMEPASDVAGGSSPADRPDFPQVKERATFLLRLDDLLLEFLKGMWAASLGYETFNWVFSEYEILRNDGQNAERQRQLGAYAAATNPIELETIGGIQGRQLWHRKEGDTTVVSLDPRAISWAYGDPSGGRGSGEERLLMDMEIGTDGPIRGSYRYWITNSEYTWQPKWILKARPVLRRSLQFALDAQTNGPARVQEERLRLARFVMGYIHPLPAELTEMVCGFIGAGEHRGTDRYVQALDLAEVYRPFPDRMKDPALECSQCGPGSGPRLSLAERTCPYRSVVVWSLPMRCFITFHPRDNRPGSDAYAACKVRDCRGHHADTNWAMRGPKGGKQLQDFLSEIVQQRCGRGESLESVGLVPARDSCLEPLPDKNEAAAFSGGSGAREKHELEAEWIGEGGIVDAMVHGGPVSHQEYPYVLGPPHYWRSRPRWMYGLMKFEELLIQETFACPHEGCYYCQLNYDWTVRGGAEGECL